MLAGCYPRQLLGRLRETSLQPAIRCRVPSCQQWVAESENLGIIFLIRAYHPAEFELSRGLCGRAGCRKKDAPFLLLSSSLLV